MRAKWFEGPSSEPFPLCLFEVLKYPTRLVALKKGLKYVRSRYPYRFNAIAL